MNVELEQVHEKKNTKEEQNTIYFGNKKKLVKDLLDMGYKVKTIIDYRKIDCNDHELYILQKKVTTTPMNKISLNYK